MIATLRFVEIFKVLDLQSILMMAVILIYESVSILLNEWTISIDADFNKKSGQKTTKA